MTIAAWLIALVGPLLARLLAALGVSLITIAGVTVALAALKSQIVSMIGSLPLAGIQLLGLYGVWQAIGIVIGTWTFLVAFKATTGWMAIAKV